MLAFPRSIHHFVKQIIEETSLPTLKPIMRRRLLSDDFVLICIIIFMNVSNVAQFFTEFSFFESYVNGSHSNGE